MKAKHVEVLKKIQIKAMEICDHDVSGEKTGMMCACSYLNKIIQEIK